MGLLKRLTGKKGFKKETNGEGLKEVKGGEQLTLKQKRELLAEALRDSSAVANRGDYVGANQIAKRALRRCGSNRDR